MTKVVPFPKRNRGLEYGKPLFLVCPECTAGTTVDGYNGFAPVCYIDAHGILLTALQCLSCSTEYAIENNHVEGYL